MAPKIIKKIAKAFGYVQIAQFLQNIFRTRFATDMYIAQVQVVSKTHEKTFGKYKNKHNGQKDAARNNLIAVRFAHALRALFVVLN